MEKVTPLFTVVVTKYYSTDTVKNTLSLVPDDIVQVLSTPNKTWWDGIIVDPVGNVSRGWFPASYTMVLNPSCVASTGTSIGSTSASPTPPVFRSPIKGSRRQSSIINSNQHHSFSSSLGKPSAATPLYQNTSSTAKNMDNNMLFSSNDDMGSFAHARHNNSLTSGKSIPHDASNSRQHSQAMTEATTASSVHLVSTEEAASYFQSANATQPGFNFVPVWVPQLTTGDDMVYFNQALNIHASNLPFIDVTYLDATSEYEVPNSQKLTNDITTPLPVTMNRENSIGSNVNQNHASEENSFNHYYGHNISHNPNQPLYHPVSSKMFDRIGRDPHNFYSDQGDFVTWENLFDRFIENVQSTTDKLHEKNKVEFRNGVNQISQTLSSITIGLRVLRDDINRKGKKAQLTLLTRKLTALVLDWRVWCQMYVIAYEIQEQDEFFTGSDNLERYKSHLVSIAPENLAKAQIQVPKISKTSKILLKLIQGLNYGHQAVSMSENVPIVYPRFVKNKFEGGNFKNQFNQSSNDVLFIDPDVQSNLLLDDELIELLDSRKEKVLLQLEKLEKILHKTIPKNVALNEFIKERNLELLTMVYQSIPAFSNYLKTVESVDFTVFTIIDKLATSGDDRHDTLVSADASNESNQWFYDTTAKIVKPMFLEMTQLKQGIHSSSTDFFLDSQAITADDPEVFFPMEMDNQELWRSLNLKIPAAESDEDLFDKAVKKYGSNLRNRLGVIDKRLFNDGMYATEPVLKLIETMRSLRERIPLLNLSLAQLKDQRMLILNYCTRLMNSDFNIASLFVAERHNTLASMSSQANLFYGIDRDRPVGAETTASDNGIKKFKLSSLGMDNDTGGENRLPWFLDADDEEKDLIYDFNGLRGGSVEGLVCKLIGSFNEPDETFEDTFLLLFYTFTTPLKLFQLLIAKYDLAMPEALSYEEYNVWVERKVKPQQQRILATFEKLFSKYWLVQYSSPELLQVWKDFTSEKEHIIMIPVELVELGYNVIRETNQNDYYTSLNLYPDTNIPIPMSPLTPEIAKLRLSDLKINDVARQLTAIQAFYYRKINQNDLLFRSYNYTKLFAKNSASSGGEFSKNISNFVRICNVITNYTAYMILRCKEQTARVDVIKYFIILAEKLLYLKNFSSMTAIISGLSLTSIARLKKTWAQVPAIFVTKFNKMDNLMSISKNYSEYRNILKFMETDGEPYMPFLGVFLSDLRFTTDGNSDMLKVRESNAKLVNFSKRVNIRNIIRQVLSFNDVTYNFPLDEQLVCYFMTIFENLPDNERQYQMSIHIEPRVSLLKGISDGGS